LLDIEWIYTFAQFTLLSSVPVLYCIALRHEVWIVLLPSLIYFLIHFISFVAANGFFRVFELISFLDLQFVLSNNPDPFALIYMLPVILMSGVFAVWALLCMFATRMINKIYDFRTITKKQRQRYNARRTPERGK
jgi:hypothetical protein